MPGKISRRKAITLIGSLPFVGLGNQNATALLMNQASRLPGNAVQMSPYKLLPEFIGSQVFSDVPERLRGSLLEIGSVQFGLRKAGVISLAPEEIINLATYLRETDLKFVVSPQKNSVGSFAQASPAAREVYQKFPRVRVYFSKDVTILRELFHLENGKHPDSSALGHHLGYPECCVKSATELDVLIPDEAGLLRQTNLVSAGISASTSLQFECNIFLRESSLARSGPSSLIFHYPCSFCCKKSTALGQDVLELAIDKWPIWAINLAEFLKSPIVYWPDDNWNSEYWDEFSGIAFPEGVFLSEYSIKSNRMALNCGATCIPGAELPEDICTVKISSQETILGRKDNSTLRIDHASTGRPYVLSWREGLILRPGENA